jgi:solute carrier family 41
MHMPIPITPALLFWLFILVPMLANLMDNLEMCLSARLGTSATIRELDHRPTRRALVFANMTILGLHALLISCLAAVIWFVLGLITIDRLGDSRPTSAVGVGVGGGGGIGNRTLVGMIQVDPGLAVGEQEWPEGYTRPGLKQLVMVLATGMGAAGISSTVLGSFMGSMLVMSRWAGIDPGERALPFKHSGGA